MFTSDLLSAKRILVTGGGTGLGKSMSRRFLELGASVVICGRRQKVLEETVTQLASEFPGRIAWYVCDIRNAGQVESTIETLWAVGALDALVNNAAGNFIAPTETLSPRAMDAILGIVLHGVSLYDPRLREALASHEAAGDGGVDPHHLRLDRLRLRGPVSHGESRRSRDDPLARRRVGRTRRPPECHRSGPVPYSGCVGTARSHSGACAELETRNPLGRAGKHRELADLASFLLADETGYINGEVVTIDGGEWLKGAGQFNFLDRLTPEEGESMRPKKAQ
jgi:NAD(P)-dependent dehydrogenase (short-subunit alcohol dehydrogenase family)